MKPTNSRFAPLHAQIVTERQVSWDVPDNIEASVYVCWVCGGMCGLQRVPLRNLRTLCQHFPPHVRFTLVNALDPFPLHLLVTTNPTTQPPNSMLCAITGELMSDPVICSDGNPHPVLLMEP